MNLIQKLDVNMAIRPVCGLGILDLEKVWQIASLG